MADPCNGAIILVTATQSALLGVCTAFDFSEVAEIIKLRGEGTLGPSCVGLVGKDLVAVVDFLVKPGIAIGTTADLVLVQKDQQGNTITDTCKNMVALGKSKRFDRENAPAVWRQIFQHMGAMATQTDYLT